MDAAIAVRHCVGTALELRLAQSRANFHARVDDFAFLPEPLSPTPMVPAYLAKENDFGLLVDWTISARIEAEALGIDKGDVEAVRKREDLGATQLLGPDLALTAQAFGLAHDWAAKVIAATGNYREIFERTVGRPYRLERGLNALWTHGGPMTPAPTRASPGQRRPCRRRNRTARCSRRPRLRASQIRGDTRPRLSLSRKG